MLNISFYNLNKQINVNFGPPLQFVFHFKCVTIKGNEENFKKLRIKFKLFDEVKKIYARKYDIATGTKGERRVWPG